MVKEFSFVVEKLDLEPKSSNNRVKKTESKTYTLKMSQGRPKFDKYENQISGNDPWGTLKISTEDKELLNGLDSVKKVKIILE